MTEFDAFLNRQGEVGEMRVWKCNLCSQTVEDLAAAKWFVVKSYTGEPAVPAPNSFWGAQDAPSVTWTFCSLSCLTQAGAIEDATEQPQERGWFG